MHSKNKHPAEYNKMKIMQKCFCLNELYDKLLLCVYTYIFSLHRPIFNIFLKYRVARQHKGMFASTIRICEFANKLRVNT